MINTYGKKGNNNKNLSYERDSACQTVKLTQNNAHYTNQGNQFCYQLKAHMQLASS